jgi:hypothetical protein
MGIDTRRVTRIQLDVGEPGLASMFRESLTLEAATKPNEWPAPAIT